MCVSLDRFIGIVEVSLEAHETVQFPNHVALPEALRCYKGPAMEISVAIWYGGGLDAQFGPIYSANFNLDIGHDLMSVIDTNICLELDWILKPFSERVGDSQVGKFVGIFEFHGVFVVVKSREKVGITVDIVPSG